MTTSPVTTVTDELLAELDRSVRVVWNDEDSVVIAVDALTSELRRLRAENAELKRALADADAAHMLYGGQVAELAKDAGRLEWMVTEGAVIARMNGTGLPMCYQVSFPFESCQQLDWFPSWREAVDAMMSTQ